VFARRPTSKSLREGTHKQTNLGYAKMVAHDVIFSAWRKRSLPRDTGDADHSAAAVEEEELTPYELERMESIRKSRLFLVELGLRSEPQ
jgi:hypothetical protein